VFIYLGCSEGNVASPLAERISYAKFHAILRAKLDAILRAKLDAIIGAKLYAII